ncbi:MAG TPA: TRAP transporter small permease [Thermodesulfobacteriota bacterium]|nr:TRAP transporter small permease [Thermodesulfobacteriota bacterium]
MDKILQRIERIAYVVGYGTGYILLGIIALTQIEVVTRYVLRQPLILCDELGGYSLLAITFLGLAYCAKEKGHIRITFLVERMSAKASGRVRVLTLILALIYIGIASKVSWDFLILSVKRGMKSNSWLMTPLYWPQMVLPVGCTLFFLVLLVQLVRTIRDVTAGVRVEEVSGEEY